MKTKWLFVALPMLMACSGGNAIAPIPFEQAAPSNAPAPSPNRLGTGIVTVGRASVDVVPDEAVLTLGVEVRATTLAAARAKAADAAQRVITALRASGVDESAMRTTQLSVHPDFDHHAGRRIGFVVGNHLRVRIDEVTRVGNVVDVAAAAGGNDLRVHGVSFRASDGLRDTAREKAFANAKAKAEQLATLSGMKLGRPISVREAEPTLANARFGNEEVGEGTPVLPGTSRPAVILKVHWSLEDA